MAIPHDALDIAASMAIDVYSNPKDWIVHRGLTATWIAIEGSDELADWRRNFEFLLTSSDEHLGFGSYARELMAQMWAQGLQVDHSIPTILCGHSLGGAVATIIAAQLQDHVPLLELVTFGSPRPGGRRLARRLRVPHHRYVHANDIVPRMPGALFGFRHTAPALMLEPFDAAHLLRGVKDHDMGIYRQLIKAQHS
ncbi:MAG: lipase family protein [Cyanobium sp. 49614_E6]|nr:lipase family protein [Cyanobium sp. 49614_E6]